MALETTYKKGVFRPTGWTRATHAHTLGVSGISNFKFFALFLTLFFSQPTLGCVEYDEIDLENLDKYSEIFIGEVMGINLDGYLASRISEVGKGLIKVDANEFSSLVTI